MNLAPTEVNPGSSVFAETLGAAPGRATAVLFAREGAAVACVDVSQEAAQRTVDVIAAADGSAFAEVADVRDASAIAPLVARCAQRLGGLDGLVLNVGISKGNPLQCRAAGLDRHPDGPRRHPAAAQLCAVSALRPAGHGLGSGVRLLVPGLT